MATPPIRKPRFGIPLLFKYLFSKDEIASYLVSKEQLPPSSLSKQVQSRSITMSSLLTPDPNAAAFLLKRADERYYDELAENDSSSQAEKNKHLSNVIPAEREEMVNICHTNGINHAFVSATDNRTPLAFLETVSTTVPGVRRLVCIKLDESDIPNAHIICTYYHCHDGRSNMTILCYQLEPHIYTEKYFVLLDRYPSYRYPIISDILETMIAYDEFLCNYCCLRGHTECQCSTKMVERLAPPIPARSQRDPWNLHVWAWCVMEPGLKKYSIVLQNYRHNISHQAHTFHETIASFGTEAARNRALQLYATALKPYFDRQMVYGGNLLMDPETLKKAKLEIANHEDEIITQQRLQHRQQSDAIEELPPDAIFEWSPELNLFHSHHPSSSRLRTAAAYGSAHVYTSYHDVELDGAMDGAMDGAKDGAGDPLITSSLGTTSTDKKRKAQADGNNDNTNRRKRANREQEPDHPIVTEVSELVEFVAARDRQLPTVPAAPAASAALEAVLPSVQQVTAEQRVMVETYMKEVDDMDWPNGERRNCAVCDVSFNRKYDLKRHLRSKHLMEKDYTCDICQMQFSRKTHLDTHIKGYHEKTNRLPCKYCDQVFRYESSKSKHMWAVHTEQMERDKTTRNKP
eukprot:CAMPEP_0184698028 /NCGR_PEP_ID=MMETSP0313-20130426/4786_1 /TAXON_ID=2792 /ORGANISM="Porphyridium aerugineum, Strain SAG 1380-2" /LENGTH=631 /DNA_ID=CAMNT_0027156905 /DNA_START=412 /DNA_END=2310 /DNA_ORIENTATION=-